MSVKNSFLIGFSLITAVAHAQQPLSVEQAVATSLQNNYDILLSKNDSLLAALDYSYANAAFLPRLNANSTLLYNDNAQKQILADGTKKERSGIKSNNLTASLNLNWTLFDGLKMFITKKRLNELVSLSQLEIKNQVVTTVADVMKLYYNIVSQQQQLKAIEEQMQLSEERLKIAQYKFDVGTGAKPDVLQAQIDLNAQRSAYLTQQTAILKSKEQLNQLLVLPLDNEFAVNDSITIDTTLALGSFQNGLETTNPSLLLAQKNVDIAQLALQERKAERYPIISFNSAYNFTRSDNKTVINPFQPLFNQNKGLNYGFTATVPIFNNFSQRRLIKAAQLDIDYQQLIYKKNLSQINTGIVNAYKDYDLSKRTLQLEESNMALVHENMFIARERYRLGISTFIELREAQNSLADATNRLIQARYNTKVAEIELMRLRGDLVKE